MARVEKFIKLIIKRKVYFFALLIVLVCLFIPKIISELYKIPNKYWLLSASFEKKEILAFWGSFLEFLGTVALGGLALWQNSKLVKVNDRLLRLEKNRDKPFIKVVSIKSHIDLKDFFIKTIHLKCSFKNIGKGFSVDTCFFAPGLQINGSGGVLHSENEYDNVFIDIGEVKDFEFSFKNVDIKSCMSLLFQINIHTEDINLIETKQLINCVLKVKDINIELATVSYITSEEYCDYTEEDFANG